MSDLSVAGPLGELDFGNEPRLHPVRVLPEPPARSRIERRGLRLDRLELRAQLATERVAPAAACTDFPGEAQRVAFVVANEHRPNAGARAFWVGESADDKFLALHALDLLPV